MIKAVLIVGLVGFSVVELRGKASAGHLALRRLVALLILLLGVTAIVFPELVTKLANLVGVGRGTDLVLYALVLAFLFSTVGLYQRMKRLEDRYVDLARSVAIDRAVRTRDASATDAGPASPTEQSTRTPAAAAGNVR
ncbi:MAG: DUF2304 domain-containing protein [Nocardioidaceae bacterium]